MQIRTATPEDAPLVEAVLHASYPALMAPAYQPDMLARALPLMTRANYALLNSGRYYLVVEDGIPLGCGGWSEGAPGDDAAEAGRAHIRHFATHPHHLGRGVGRTIFDRCNQEAAAAGFVLFECRSSLNGEPFYEALGFRRVRSILERMGPDFGFPAVLMERPIRLSS